MHFAVVLRILGLVLMFFSLTLLPSVGVSWGYADGAAGSFLEAFVVTLVTGFLCWIPVRRSRQDLRLRDGFLIVVLVWTVVGLFGALPFMLAENPHLGPTDAIFESISGFTTTGATVIQDIHDLPQSIQYYRQQIQWLGGMGIIVLAVAVLPMLGVGGMQLYRAETPGPMKDTKLTPRITETAKALWYIYLGLTIACAIAYWLAGMTLFDAIGHSFATMATGGFSTHDLSMGYFHSALLEGITDVFMLLAGINFALHFLAWRRRSLQPYLTDPEVQTYVSLLAMLSVVTTLYLYVSETFDSFGSALHHGIFQTISFWTTTGYTTAEYFSWPGFLPVILLFSSFVGGCGGSTGGGIKVIRFLLLYRQGIREIGRLVHPNAQIPVKIGNKTMPEKVISAVWGFFSLYVGCFSLILLGLMSTGLDQVTAFSAVAACMNNLGPGLGEVSANYGMLNDPSKWMLTFAMLLGRLEIYTLFVLFTSTFWRR